MPIDPHELAGDDHDRPDRNVDDHLLGPGDRSARRDIAAKDLRGGDDARVDVLGAELDAGAEKRVHGALRVGRHQDKTARRRRAALHGLCAELHAERFQIAGEGRAEAIAAELADIGALAAERGDPGDAVGDRAARAFAAGDHLGVKRLGLAGIDQRHGAFVEALAREEGVVDLDQHVDNRITDADDIEGWGSHERSDWGGGGEGGRSIGSRPPPASFGRSPRAA